jgi:hypothetical protein
MERALKKNTTLVQDGLARVFALVRCGSLSQQSRHPV